MRLTRLTSLLAPELCHMIKLMENDCWLAFAALMRCGALCSTATLNADGSVRGDASETAILNFVSEYDDVGAMRGEFPKVAEIPFNSVIKYQVSIYNIKKFRSAIRRYKMVEMHTYIPSTIPVARRPALKDQFIINLCIINFVICPIL